MDHLGQAIHPLTDMQQRTADLKPHQHLFPRTNHHLKIKPAKSKLSFEERHEVLVDGDLRSASPSGTHVYAHVYTNVHTHVYTHVCTHVYTHVCTHVYTHIYTHVYTQVHTHVCTHTHSTHAYTHFHQNS